VVAVRELARHGRERVLGVVVVGEDPVDVHGGSRGQDRARRGACQATLIARRFVTLPVQE
jgi:hypothetical protein